MVMLFSSVGQNKRRKTCYLLVQMAIYGENSYFGHISKAKYSKHPHRCGDWLLHIHLKALDTSALKLCRSTTPCKQDNSVSNCNSWFSNRDGNKEAKLTDFSFTFLKHKTLKTKVLCIFALNRLLHRRFHCVSETISVHTTQLKTHVTWPLMHVQP